MKRILLAAGLALIIHGFFLGVDPAWLKKSPIHRPETRVLTMNLFYRQPLRAKPKPTMKRPESSPRKSPTVLIKKKKQILPKIEKPERSPAPVKPAKPLPVAAERKKKDSAPEPEKPKEIPTPSTPTKSIRPTEKSTALRQEPSDIPESKPAPPPKTELADINKGISSGLDVLGDEVFEKEIAGSDKGLEPLPPPSVGITVQEAEPLYRKNPRPEYPRLARRRGYEGTVVLEVLVNDDGTVKDLRLFSSSEHRVLDRAAMASVKKWLFKPGMRGEEPVEMWVRVPIRFQLK